jgi:hypothetical protein
MNIQPSTLTPLLVAHAKMREIQHPLTLGVRPARSDLRNVINTYKDEYELVRKQLGYLSVLDYNQFAVYLDDCALYGVHSDDDRLSGHTVDSLAHAEHVVSHLHSTNYYFQMQAYAQIAKVCGFALLIICSVALYAALLPAATGGYLAASLGSGACALTAGLSIHGLFGAARKITPSAEDMISHVPLPILSL